MTRTSPRGARRLARLLLAVAMVIPAVPASATEPSGQGAQALTTAVGDAAVTQPGAANAIGLSLTLAGLLGQALGALDDGPWVPAANPHGLPINLAPTLPIANVTKARAYADGCHVHLKVRKARGCAYGDTDSDFTVLLMGDSHGAMWLPAFEEIAARRDWKIHLLTKSSCPPPRISVRNRGAVYAACDTWRTNAFKVIRKLEPDLAVLTSTADYKLDGIRDRYSRKYLRAWRKAWADTIETVGKAAGEVVVLNDVPKWNEDSVECLTEHADDVRVCATARDVAVRPDMTKALREAAKDAGATFVDPSVLVCPDDPCPVVDGRYLITYDTSHLTPVFARLVSPQLEAMLPIPAE